MSSANANLLNQIIAKNNAIADTQRITLLEKTKQALKQLSREFSWKEIYFFGSITQKGRFGKHSDVDIAIKGLNKYLHYRFVGQLSSMINRDVDVVRLEDNCVFKDYILQEGIRWTKEA